MAGADYVSLDQDGFTEAGAPGFNLAVKGRDDNSLRPYAGLSVARVFQTEDGMSVKPIAEISYSHELLSGDRDGLASVGGADFTIAGIARPRDEFNLGLTVDVRIDDRFTAYGTYKTVFSANDYVLQTLSGGLEFRF